MKKLMIVAAVAALAGVASAADGNACTPSGNTTTGPCATVYAVKFALKTPTGEPCKTTGAASTCAPGTDSTGYVRTPSSIALQGWFADCSCKCEALKNFTQNHIAIWNAKEKNYLSDIAYNVDLLHVLSKSQANAEIYFTLNGTLGANTGLARKFELIAAGFGKFSKGSFTSFSGNVVGKVSKVMYPKAVNVGTAERPNWICPEAGYWTCATVANGCAALVTTEKSIAYGTFAITYNKAASTKMAQAKGFPTLPEYVPMPTGWTSAGN